MNILATRNMTLIVLGTAAIEVHAQEWLLGGAIGIARQQDYEVGAPIATRDDKDTAFRLFGGYRLSPHWNQDVTLTDASGTMEYADDGTSLSLGFGADINLSSDGTAAAGTDSGRDQPRFE